MQRYTVHVHTRHDDFWLSFSLSLSLCSQWNHPERPVEHLRPQPRVVSHPWQNWNGKLPNKKRKHQTKDLTSCLSCSDYSRKQRKRKCKGSKCKCVVHMTRVQRVPCSYINNAFMKKWSKEWITWLTYLPPPASKSACLCLVLTKTCFYISSFGAVCKWFSAFELCNLYIQHLLCFIFHIWLYKEKKSAFLTGNGRKISSQLEICN